MKKIIVLICSLFLALFISSVCVFANTITKVKVDLGLNILNSQSDIESIYGNIEGKIRRGDLGFKFDNKLYREKQDDVLKEHIKETKIQTMFYTDPFYFIKVKDSTFVCYLFLEASDARHLSLGIDEVDLGLGAGYEQALLGIFNDIELKTGIYTRDKEEIRNYFSKMFCDFLIPLNKILWFEESTQLQVCLQDIDNYRFLSNSSICIKAYWDVNLVVGFDFTYNNDNVVDLNTVTRYYCALSFNF